MRRRQFIGDLLAAGVLRGVGRDAALAGQPQEPLVSDPTIKRVLVVFKCHFDAGFIDTQANVVRRYFDQHFPRAIETSAALKRKGSDRYVWTAGSWLVYQYLEKASPARKKEMEQAIVAGDVAWHAIPFTWQTELMDRSLIAGGIGFSHSLDRRFGRTTTGAKMTDVPGHTRAIIGPLAAQGVKLLDLDRRRDRLLPFPGPPFRAHHDRRQNDGRSGAYPRHHRSASGTGSETAGYRRQLGEHTAGRTARLSLERRRRPFPRHSVPSARVRRRGPDSRLRSGPRCRGER